MSTFLHAIELFLNRFTEIGWHWVGLALIAHSLKTLARTRAWRNILRVTYPDARVRWRSVLGAYVAGVGVNAVVPARGGDLIKLYLVRRRIDGATYPTLATTLVVETAFDFVIAMGLLVWAVSLGVLPALNVLPGLDAFDWAWIWRHPIETGAIAGALVLVGGFLLIRGARRVGAFRRKVAQGFTVWRRPVVYFGSVVPWQALDWILRIAEIYLFLLAFGVAATVDKAMVVQVVSGVSTVLPFTPAGIGTEQALLVFAFAGTIEIGTLLAFSVGTRAIVVSFNLIVGFAAIAIMLRTLRWRRHVENDREPHAIPVKLEPEPGVGSP